ncbi:MAG: class I SAM-dependent methyltransferase [Acholeplasmatales bacterium]|nr:class I SAM-dependent methyltransferase [Acholeplasmatales bacterium]
MNEELLKNYYNKFNEDKRLNSRHGIVEFNTSIKYILEYLNRFDNPKILDLGAGTGKYSLYLDSLGYDVTAVELVKHNLKYITMKNPNIKAFLGNALDLKFKDESFDFIIMFGPIYHLIDKDEKIKALNEAKRVLKKDGIIFICYYMNDYAVINHGFIDNFISESINNNEVDNDYKIIGKENDLYSYSRIEDIDELNKVVGFDRIDIFTPDLLTDYMRKIINKMDDKTFEAYLDYVYKVSNRKELIGIGSHIVDIVKKK